MIFFIYVLSTACQSLANMFTKRSFYIHPEWWWVGGTSFCNCIQLQNKSIFSLYFHVDTRWGVIKLKLWYNKTSVNKKSFNNATRGDLTNMFPFQSIDLKIWRKNSYNVMKRNMLWYFCQICRGYPPKLFDNIFFKTLPKPIVNWSKVLYLEFSINIKSN